MTVSPHLRRSFARGLRGLIVVTLLLVTGCKARGCSWSKSGEANLAVTMGKLSADPLTGARELGTAAAKSKDEGALAGKLLAMLERLEVPVLSTDGSKALVTAHLSNPPKEIFFWEPIIVGLARSTVQGDSRPMSVVFRKMFPQADDATVKQLDFSTLFAKLATDVAAAKATTHDALLVTAIAEDLQQRGMPVRDPRIDPVGAALFVMWLSLTQAPAPSPAAGSGVPAIPSNFPGLPPGFKIRGLNNQLPPAPAGAGGYVCSAFASAVAGLGTAYSAFGSATKLGQFAPGGAGTAFGNWNKAMSYGAKLVELPILALEAIVALGIVAFVDINGDVNGSSTSAPKVKYGDPPVKFTMHVASTNPLSKKELDAFINCLEALSTVGAPFWEELRNLPPHGPIGSAPVVWLGWEELDPEHGTFTVDKGWNASKGLKDALAVAGRQLAANGKTSLTTSTGEATAEFKPKPKPGPTQKFTTIVKSVNVYANLFPFPVSTSKVYGVANVLFSREVPLRLELELPFPKDWVMTVHQETDTTGQGVSGGWSRR